MYETVKGIADQYVDQLQKIFDEIEGLLTVVNDLVHSFGSRNGGPEFPRKN